jgi:hypothetical protein
MNGEIDKFKEQLKKFEGCWDSIDLKVVAVNQEDEWINIGTLAVLTVEEEEVEEVLYEVEGLKILHAIKRFDYLNRLFQDLSRNVVEACGIETVIKKDLRYTMRGLSSLGDTNWKGKGKWREGAVLSDYISTDMLGKGLLERIENRLRKHEKEPYEYLSDVTKAHFGQQIDGTTNGIIGVVAPFYMGIKEHKLEKGKWKLVVECHKSIDYKKLSSTVFLDAGEGAKQGIHFHFTEEDTKESTDGDFYQLEKVKSFPSKPKHVSLYLYYEKEETHFIKDLIVDKLIIRHPLKSVFFNFCEDERLKNHILFPSDKGEFEWAIASLLPLCGFDTIWLGGFEKGGSKKDYYEKPKVKGLDVGGIDVISGFFTRGKSYILLVGCTTSVIKDDDIEKIVNVKGVLEEGLKIERLQFMPIIFSCKEISLGLKESAGKSGVATAGPEKLKDMFRFLEEGRTTKEIFKGLFNSIRYKGTVLLS